MNSSYKEYASKEYVSEQIVNLKNEIGNTDEMLSYENYNPILPLEDDWYGMVEGNGRLVAVTMGGIIAYSDDGINWIETGAFELDRPSITYGNNLFVIVDESGNTLYSSDGISWSKGQSLGGAIWYSITYGNGKFVALGCEGNVEVAYSVDGINWTSLEVYHGAEWNDITHGDGRFVAVASYSDEYYSMYSTDGINWVGSNLPTGTWRTVTYGDGKFVVAGYIEDDEGNQESYAACSIDGIDWDTISLDIGGYLYYSAYGNGRFVVVSDDCKTAISTDGYTWESYKMPEGFPSFIYYANGLFHVLETESAYRFLLSKDGITWSYSVGVVTQNSEDVTNAVSETIWNSVSPRVIPLVDPIIETKIKDNQIEFDYLPVYIEKSNWRHLAYGVIDNTVRIIAPRSGNNAAGIAKYSDDGGITWYNTINNNEVNTAFGKNKFVSIHGSSVSVSEDGINWTSSKLPGTNAYSDFSSGCLTYGNGLFVCIIRCGQTNYMSFVSSDGYTWIESTVPSLLNRWDYETITYGNGMFVAVGTSKSICSVDGLSWTEASISIGAPVKVIFVDDKFFLVNSIGDIYTSIDGLSWSSIGSVGVSDISDLAYGNGIFVCTSESSVMSSTDGSVWEQSVALAAYAVSYVVDRFIAIVAEDTNYDAVYFSEDGKSWISAIQNAIRQGEDLSAHVADLVWTRKQFDVIRTALKIVDPQIKRLQDELDNIRENYVPRSEIESIIQNYLMNNTEAAAAVATNYNDTVTVNEEW